MPSWFATTFSMKRRRTLTCLTVTSSSENVSIMTCAPGSPPSTQLPQLHRVRTQPGEHLRGERCQPEGLHQVQHEDQGTHLLQVVQATPLQDARYSFNYLECPETLFGIESAMTFDGMKDPYARASIVEYIHFMRLTADGHILPKVYVYS